MLLYRITKTAYADTLQASGRANRWNRDKEYVIYTAYSRALAALELVAHRSAIMEGVTYRVVVIRLPEDPGVVREVSTGKLLKKWHLLANRHRTQSMGSEWYMGRQSLALKVPSALIPQEYNVVLNTMHPDFPRVTIERTEDFRWDPRLL